MGYDFRYIDKITRFLNCFQGCISVLFVKFVFCNCNNFAFFKSTAPAIAACSIVHRECNEYLSSARVGDPPARSKSNANIYPSLNSNCLKLSLTVWALPVARVLPSAGVHLFVQDKLC